MAPGVRRITKQIAPYTQWWSAQNQQALAAEGPLWIVLGDSTSIGIGASGPDRGYVGRVRSALRATDPDWRVINLAMSGARVDDGLERQLPLLVDLVGQATEPPLVSMCLGSNDVFWERSGDLRERLKRLVGLLPPGSHVASVAGTSDRAKLANRALRGAARDLDLPTLNPWNEPGPGERLAEDRFHPNDLGYHYLSQAFARSFGVPGPPADQH